MMAGFKVLLLVMFVGGIVSGQRYPFTNYPITTYPTTNYPITTYPTTNYPITAYPTTPRRELIYMNSPVDYVCPSGGSPVCATNNYDNFYFENDCRLEAYNHKQLYEGKLELLRIDASHCYRNCEFMYCEDKYEPVCGLHASTYKVKTFSNKCELNREICLSKSEWIPFSEGACSGMSTRCYSTYNPVCAAFDGVKRIFENYCELKRYTSETRTPWHVVDFKECSSHEPYPAVAYKPAVSEYKPAVPEYKPAVPAYKPAVPEYKSAVPAYKPTDATKTYETTVPTVTYKPTYETTDAAVTYETTEETTDSTVTEETTDADDSEETTTPAVTEATTLPAVTDAPSENTGCLLGDNTVCAQLNDEHRTFANPCEVLQANFNSTNATWVVKQQGPCPGDEFLESASITEGTITTTTPAEEIDSAETSSLEVLRERANQLTANVSAPSVIISQGTGNNETIIRIIIDNGPDADAIQTDPSTITITQGEETTTLAPNISNMTMVELVNLISSVAGGQQKDKAADAPTTTESPADTTTTTVAATTTTPSAVDIPTASNNTASATIMSGNTTLVQVFFNVQPTNEEAAATTAAPVQESSSSSPAQLPCSSTTTTTLPPCSSTTTTTTTLPPCTSTTTTTPQPCPTIPTPTTQQPVERQRIEIIIQQVDAAATLEATSEATLEATSEDPTTTTTEYTTTEYYTSTEYAPTTTYAPITTYAPSTKYASTAAYAPTTNYAPTTKYAKIDTYAPTTKYAPTTTYEKQTAAASKEAASSYTTPTTAKYTTAKYAPTTPKYSPASYTPTTAKYSTSYTTTKKPYEVTKGYESKSTDYDALPKTTSKGAYASAISYAATEAPALSKSHGYQLYKNPVPAYTVKPCNKPHPIENLYADYSPVVRNLAYQTPYSYIPPLPVDYSARIVQYTPPQSFGPPQPVNYGPHPQYQPQNFRQYPSPNNGQYPSPNHGQYPSPNHGQYASPNNGQYQSPFYGDYQPQNSAPYHTQYQPPIYTPNHSQYQPQPPNYRPQGQYQSSNYGPFGSPFRGFK